jgi:membrane-bound lytic murein transglycosylase D
MMLDMKTKTCKLIGVVIASLLGASSFQSSVAANTQYFFGIGIPVQQPTDFWVALSQQFHLPSYTHELAVRAAIQRLQKAPDYFYELTRNASSSIYYVLEEAHKRGIPAEIALLPMVESDYNPTKTSPVGAKGLWQLMSGTASGFGIRTNSWYDGRRDVVASTHAALNYLQYLHDMFHDWLLAVAAYNSGEGRVMNAIKRNQRLGKPTDFWSLKLPQETQQYVPKLLALAAILANPKAYGLTPNPVANKPFFTALSINGSVNLAKLAEDTHTPLKTLQWLNPAFKSTVVHPGKLTKPYAVLIPTEQVNVLRQSLAQQQATTTRTHA